MRLTDLLGRWPVYRQLRGADGRREAARSARTDTLRPRTEEADRVARSVCPYCAVGCGQLVYVKDGAVTQIEGDPDSPISRGRLCPKGAASKQLVTRPERPTIPAGASRDGGACEWTRESRTRIKVVQQGVGGGATSH